MSALYPQSNDPLWTLLYKIASNSADIDVAGGGGGTLAVTAGGTGATSFTANAILKGNGTSPIQASQVTITAGAFANVTSITASAATDLALNAGSGNQNVNFQASGTGQVRVLGANSNNTALKVLGATSAAGNIISIQGNSTNGGTVQIYSDYFTTEGDLTLGVFTKKNAIDIAAVTGVTTFNAGVVGVGATGGSQGAGTGNFSALYVNGVAVGTSTGNVSTTGSPASTQIATFTDGTTIKGQSNIIYTGGVFTVTNGGTVKSSVVSTVNGAVSTFSNTAPNSTGTSRTFRIGLNSFVDDAMSIDNGTTEYLRLNLTNGNATLASTTAATSSAGALVMSGGLSQSLGSNRQAVYLTNSSTTDILWSLANTSVGGVEWQLRSVGSGGSAGATVGQFGIFSGGSLNAYVLKLDSATGAATFAGPISAGPISAASSAAGSTPLVITSSSTATALPLGTFLAANQVTNSSAGTGPFLAYGVSTSTNQAGVIQFLYTGSASANNAVQISLYGNGNILKFDGNGTLTVPGTTEATTGAAGALTSAGGIYAAKKIITASTLTTLGGATLHTTSSSLTDGAGVALGTLATAPSAGNPTKWIGINDNGTTRYVPAW